MELLKKNPYYVLLALAGIFAAYGFWAWHIDPNLVGVVESRFHSVGAREGGRIEQMLVAVGDEVKTGQELVRLDVSDLDEEKGRLQEELATLGSIMKADRLRYALEYDRLRLRVSEQFAAVQANLAELNALNREIKMLQDAEDAGLGHGRDLSELIIRRDTLSRFISEQAPRVQHRIRGNSTGQTTSANDSVLTSMLGDRMARIHETLYALVLIDQRIDYRTVKAPCDGPVVEILARAGDTVDAYIPIITVEDTRVSFLEVYIPETQDHRVEVGRPVIIYSKRSNDFNTTGRITFVHPGFSPMPDRLMFRGQIAWARKLRVELAPGHSLEPGESVRVKLLKRGNIDDGVFGTARATQKETLNDEDDGRKIRHMNVPEKLLERTRFEPSGLAWLPKIQRYLVVSDDTGLPDGTDDHAPWLFLMDEHGTVEAEPIVLQGVQSVNDLEAVAPALGGLLYLVSSQNASKKGKRPSDRLYLIEARRDGRTFAVERKIAFLSLVLASYDKKKLRALGLTDNAADGKPRLNIEGAAWRDGSLYFGLKQPTSDEGAIIWKLDDVDRLMADQRLKADQLSLVGRVKLHQPGAVPAGVSDLAFDPQGRMIALSTIPGASHEMQTGGVHLIRRQLDGRLDAKLIESFPNRKPEGVCFRHDGGITVVFDADDGQPSLIEMEINE